MAATRLLGFGHVLGLLEQGQDACLFSVKMKSGAAEGRIIETFEETKRFQVVGKSDERTTWQLFIGSKFPPMACRVHGVADPASDFKHTSFRFVLFTSKPVGYCSTMLIRAKVEMETHPSCSRHVLFVSLCSAAGPLRKGCAPAPKTLRRKGQT